MTSTLTIERRFAGPPFAANGGHVAGLLAERAGLRAAHVGLRAPVPLERVVEVVSDGPSVALTRHGRRLASGWPASLLDLSHPQVDYVTAAVVAGDVSRTDHPFPGCWVCGPDRTPGDGLHLFPGRVRPGVVAVPWRPAPWQADPTGTVPVRVVTAALDCPSAFAVVPEGGTALLASMTFVIVRLPRVGEELVAIGWAKGVSGRKMLAATAVVTAAGETLAKAENLWIGVDASRLDELAAASTGVAA